MSDGAKQGVFVREWLKGVLRLAEVGEKQPPGGGEPPQPGEKFPMAGLDLINHTVRVSLSAGGQEEIVALQGTMVIQRSDPYTNKETGRRQIDFKVRSWVASAWSNTLNGVISYVLSERVGQPVSIIFANQVDSDFPATFDFNVIFDVRYNNKMVFPEVEGRPVCEQYMAVPPNGDRRLCPTVRTFKDKNKARIAHPQLGEIVATPIDCNDQDTSRTLVEFPGMPLD